MADGSPYQPERSIPEDIEGMRHWVQVELDKLSTVIGAINSGRIRVGSGTPLNVVVAPTGTAYLDSTGGAATTLYIKESGVDSTGWVAK